MSKVSRFCIAASLFLCTSGFALGQSISAELTIRADQPKNTISRNIYGQFAEHLGRCIYEGVWVGENSPIPNTRGIRNDVVAALKNLSVPFVRWPGGCFADEYHWRDGIGPRDQRPKRVNTHWGGVIDTNAFGTHEFMDFCEMIGASPYISGNVGTGTPQEMMEWVEYMTSDADSTLANERRKNGHEKAWKVPFFGVGNESWGCGGNMTPEYYSDEFRRFGTFVNNYSSNRITKIASGSNGDDMNWTDVLMSHVGRQMNGISLHWYTLPTGNWSNKGSATQFNEDQWFSTLAQAMHMEELLEKHSAIMDKYDPQKRIGLVVDEWGTWYNPEPGSTPGFLYQQNGIRDAVVAGINLNLFHQHSDRVTMAAIAQMVNVLQTMILTDKEKMILTPTYYVFEMYKVHQGATLIPVELKSPDYKLGGASLPGLSASASRDSAGKIHVSIVNLDPNHTANVATKVSGLAFKKVSGRILTAPTMNAINTFENPDNVKPALFTDMNANGDALHLNLPAKSVVVLEIE